jgi:signal transduction histidine kinase
LRRIQESGIRLHRLVEQILQMLRAGRFERPLDCRPVDCAALVGEAIDSIRPFIELRRQQLIIELPSDPCVLNVEAGKIRICLDHLLINAIKFTPDGGTIAVRGWRDGNTVNLQVRDTGIGIAGEQLPHLFEPFFTEMDVSRHSSGQFEFGRRGLGLGLSVVRAFVAMHGGTVDVTSTPGQGTAFTIMLPVSEWASGACQRPGETNRRVDTPRSPSDRSSP